jgi:membrane dipeptidase
MNVIDLHCDTLSRIALVNPDMHLDENTLHLDVGKMRRAGYAAVVFSLFPWFGADGPLSDAPRRIEVITRRASEEIARCPDLCIVHTRRDWDECRQSEKIAVLLSLEGGEGAAGLEDMEALYRFGVRIVNPVWNRPNVLGYPALGDDDKGLTPYGRAVVAWMETRGMLVDVSHLSDSGIRDVAGMARKPFIASHSDARALADHPRNIPDDLIRAVAESGGVVGINTYGPHLGEDREPWEAIAAHIRHVYEVGGVDCPAIGADFDGDPEMVFAGAGEMESLPDRLHKAGFTPREVEKICTGNAARVIESVLP